MEAVQSWVSQHKLTSIGTLWASGIGASLAYNLRSSMKPSLRLIHARMHAQALTLGVLSTAAFFHYYDQTTHHAIAAAHDQNDKTTPSNAHANYLTYLDLC